MVMIINGVPAPVEDAGKVRDELLFFPKVNKNTKAWKRKEPLGIGLHWTGAENPAARVAKTLISRELSIHFVVDLDEITQFADPGNTRCAHMGIGNGRIGIEIVNRGFATKADVRGTGLRDRTELDWTKPRDVYRGYVDGEATNLASFTPKQVDNTLWLVETLSGLFGLPRLIPYIKTKQLSRRRSDRLALPVPHKAGHFYVPTMDRDPRRWGHPGRPARAKTFQGTLGHFHLHPNKWDPGTQLFFALWGEGFNPLGRKFPDWRNDRRFR